MLWPNGTTKRPDISSPFGPRSSGAYGDASTWHLGTDLVGFDTVHAVADGEVVYVGWNSGVGWSTVAGFMVWVQHDGFFSRSLHTDSGTVRVKVGDRVRAGDPLVDVGYSGLTDGAGNPAPWRRHVHVEITPGTWHTGNIGQVDPVEYITARLGQSAGGGGSAPDTTITSEEDDMRLILLQDPGSSRDGTHFAIGFGGIVQIDKDTVKMNQDSGAASEVPVREASFKALLRAHGIPEEVVDGQGRILNDREGQGNHERYGRWHASDKGERLAWLAQRR